MNLEERCLPERLFLAFFSFPVDNFSQNPAKSAETFEIDTSRRLKQMAKTRIVGQLYQYKMAY